MKRNTISRHSGESQNPETLDAGSGSGMTKNKIPLNPPLSKGEDKKVPPFNKGGPGGISLAQRMRDALRNLREPVRPMELSEILGLQTYRERKMVVNTLQDFLRRGEVTRPEPGKYHYVRQAEKPSHVGTIWSILRSARGWQTIDQIEALCPGIPRDVITESLRGWIAMDRVRNKWVDDHYSYRLIKDSGPRAPKNQPKADRLKRLRLKLKIAQGIIQKAQEEIESWNEL